MLRIVAVTCVLLAGSHGILREDNIHPRSKSVPYTRINADELDSPFWQNKAQNFLEGKVNQKLNTNVAKNVILFLGDGMSVPTLASARSLLGERQGLTSGEGIPLSFEKFPFSGLSQTYCVDYKVADSACSATAYLGGVKGNKGTIGVTARVQVDDCAAMNDAKNHVQSIAKWFQDQGLATGLVSTARVTHASPAGVFAHTANRNWEDDTNVSGGGADPKSCADIARQLVQNEPGKSLKVILGGGRQGFLPKQLQGAEEGGVRNDGRNLVQDWQNTRNGSNVYVTNRTQLLSLSNTPDNLLGLFSRSHMEDHMNNAENEPTLEEMTIAAIKVLQKSGDGFFLFVEGAKIDLAHHGNQAEIALDETIEFAKAISAALNITDDSETLIVVTADHAHTMSFSGYTERDKSILDFAGQADDKKPYLALSYANGPGFALENGERPDLNNDENLGKYNYVYPAGVPIGSETHGGDDVAVFANGPWAHLFTGSFEENYIPHAMAYASCVGSGQTACSQN